MKYGSKTLYKVSNSSTDSPVISENLILFLDNVSSNDWAKCEDHVIVSLFDFLTERFALKLKVYLIKHSNYLKLFSFRFNYWNKDFEKFESSRRSFGILWFLVIGNTMGM